jgi:hypothetical protein
VTPSTIRLAAPDLSYFCGSAGAGLSALSPIFFIMLIFDIMSAIMGLHMVR